MIISISSTYDSKYLYFLPIVSKCWHILNCKVICFMPYPKNDIEKQKIEFINKNINENCSIHFFNCEEHKKITYTQCSRLYAAAIESIPDDEYIMISDVDMAVFRTDYFSKVDEYKFNVFGYDLTPDNEYPMCYIKAKASLWRKYFIKNRTYQECLDDLLENIYSNNFSGKFWGKDQEEAYDIISKTSPLLIKRAKEGTKFASRRLDRDNVYILENDHIFFDEIDYHMNRPGYDENNSIIIESLLNWFFQNKFEHLKKYKKEWIQMNW